MTASITHLPPPSVDTPALIAARERASHGVADEADAALLSESRHGTDRILARNTLAVIEADRILAARSADAPYALDVQPEDGNGDGGMVVAALVAVSGALVVAALIVFAAAAAHSAFVAAGGF